MLIRRQMQRGLEKRPLAGEWDRFRVAIPRSLARANIGHALQLQTIIQQPLQSSLFAPVGPALDPCCDRVYYKAQQDEKRGRGKNNRDAEDAETLELPNTSDHLLVA